MSIFRTNDTPDSSARSFDAIELTESDVATIEAASSPRDAIHVRPYRDNGGIDAMDRVLTSLHSVEEERTGGLLSRGRENTSPAHSFELRYVRDAPGSSNRVVALQYVPGSNETAGQLSRQLQTEYSDSQIEERPAAFLDVEPGQYLVGATLQLRRYTLYPINNVDLDGFGADPIGNIISEMVGSDSRGDGADVAVQIQFQPNSRGWLNGVENGQGTGDDMDDREYISDAPSVQELTYSLRQSTYEEHRTMPWPLPGEWETIEHDPSQNDLDAAKMLEQQTGKAWHLNIRIFAVADDPGTAVKRVRSTGQMFGNFYEFRTEQTFVTTPIAKEELVNELVAASCREWEETGMVKSQKEIAGLVNVPKAEDVASNKMQWALSVAGEGVPVGTPRFDFESAGVSATARAEEKQVAMLDSSTSGDPFWFGFGNKFGTEVGVFEEYLNAHMMVTGGTRKGKTTALTNLASQIYDRDYGGLVIVNGKEHDEDRFIEEWPEDRPTEDFVFVDTGDDYDKRVRFNLLEIPGSAKPGTAAHASAVEALADDWAASFAEAGGGSDSYWGSLMNRITRTVVRGMSQSDRTCTPLDIAAACSASENLEKFESWMSEERIHFVREAAQRIAEKEDGDLEPLAGRMDLLTQHAGIRNFMSARNPSASIQEFVEEGKVVVVRIDPHLGETETKFMLTPLVRRFYTAKRTAPDAPRFYLIWDEFDKAVSPRTNIHEMLSIAGGHDFRMILACQAPSNQLYDGLKDAMQNQIDTAVSFGTGKKDARYIESHHDGIESSDIANIGRFKFWLRTYYRTEDDEDKTYSFPVKAFPPAREVRQSVLGEEYCVDAEAMKRASVKRYGDIPETAEELKRESHFYGAQEDASGLGDSLSVDSALAYKAVYDARLSVGGESVMFEELEPRLRWYLGIEDAHAGQLEDVLDRLVNQHLREKQEMDGEIRYSVAPEGIEELGVSGTSGSSGHAPHRRLCRRAYEVLTPLGGDVRIFEQGGDDDAPDFTVTLPPAEVDVDASSLRGLAAGTVITGEAECSTGSTQPSQTGRNLAQAIASTGFCLFVVEDGGEDGFVANAQRVYETLMEPPLVRERTSSRVDYYMSNKLSVRGTPVWRPRTTNANGNTCKTVWWRDLASDEVVLGDREGREFARVAVDEIRGEEGIDGSALLTGEDVVSLAHSEVDAERWQRVPIPLIPEFVGLEEMEVVQDQWEILVIPADEREMGPALYRGGEVVSLEEIKGDVSKEVSESGFDVSQFKFDVE